jgi:hypothetical protein
MRAKELPIDGVPRMDPHRKNSARLGCMSGRSFRAHLSWPPGLDTVWLLSPAFAIAAVAWLRPIRPFDYFWALVQGRATIQLGGIARENLFLHTLPPETPFFNQAWLGQLVLFAGQALAGHTLNLVLLGVLLGATLVVLMDAALRTGALPVHVALVALVSLPLIGIGSGVRTQMFAYPCFALVLRHLLLDGARAPRRDLGILLVAVVLWANVHGSFVLAPALIAIRGVLRTVQRPPAGWSRPAISGNAVLELGLVVAATAVNPRGPTLYAYVLGIADAVQLARGTNVAEWQPLSFREPFAWVLMVAIGMSVVLATARRQRVERAALAAFLVFSGGSFVSQRFLTWAALASIVALPPLLRREVSVAADARRGSAWVNAGLLAGLAAATLGSLPGRPLFAHFARSAHLPYANARALGREVPLRTVERLAREGYPGRIFHHQAIGGALEWALAEGRPKPVAFVDQRFELTPPSLWHDYFVIALARPGFRELLDRYEIGTLLIDERENRPLVDAMTRDTAWRLVSREFSYRLYQREMPRRSKDG